MEDSMQVLKGLRISSFDEEEIEQNDGDVCNVIINDDDDDDDDDEVCIPVTLGFVERAEKPWALSRQLFPSKARGSPAWLDPINLPSGRSSMCDFCGEPLQFLLQVYGPISEKESSFHRVLYVFTCMSMTCQLRDQHEQWRHEPHKPSRRNPPKYDGTDKPLGSGAPLCTWCGTWKGDKVCSSCKRARYCSEKHQSIHWRSGHKVKCRQITVASQVSGASPACSTPSEEIQEVASTSLWPEFEIKIEDECEPDEEIPQVQVDEAGKLDSDGFEVEQGDDEKVSWATFHERVGRALSVDGTPPFLWSRPFYPSAVVVLHFDGMYCRDHGARPLWPVSSGRPSKADIPKCSSYCGGDRSFECQILPQLMYYFKVPNETDSVDWATIAVYTCADSCEASAAYKEEFAWVQLTPQSA